MTTDPGFDVKRFAATAAGPMRARIPVEAFDGRPLPVPVLDALGGLAALEGATMATLRLLLVTPTHKDARVTAFLVTWAYERYWIADALAAVLEANGRTAPPRAGGRTPSPLLRALATFASGDEVVGAQSAVGLVDDWMLMEAYNRITAAADHPVLDQVVADILEVKARHTAFLEDETSRRLLDPRTARLARRRLGRSRWPLGLGSLPASGQGAVLAVLDEPARTRLRARIAGIPGVGAATATGIVARIGA